MDLVVIAAVAANGVIGADGDIPWHHPEDLRHFKETTMGCPVLMGRRTYESIARDLGGPLPGRTNVVLSRSAPDLGGETVAASDLDLGGDTAAASAADTVDASTPDLQGEVIVAGSVDEAVAAAESTGSEVAYVAGGGAVYEALLDRADRMVLTELHAAHEGDTTFPEWDPDDWVEREREEHGEFDFVVYERADG